jgi:hypothetical protein
MRYGLWDHLKMILLIPNSILHTFLSGRVRHLRENLTFAKQHLSLSLSLGKIIAVLIKRVVYIKCCYWNSYPLDSSRAFSWTCSNVSINDLHPSIFWPHIRIFAAKWARSAKKIGLTIRDKIYRHFLPKKRKVPYSSFIKCLVFLPILMLGENPEIWAPSSISPFVSPQLGHSGTNFLLEPKIPRPIKPKAQGQ